MAKCLSGVACVCCDEVSGLLISSCAFFSATQSPVEEHVSTKPCHEHMNGYHVDLSLGALWAWVSHRNWAQTCQAYGSSLCSHGWQRLPTVEASLLFHLGRVSSGQE